MVANLYPNAEKYYRFDFNTNIQQWRQQESKQNVSSYQYKVQFNMSTLSTNDLMVDHTPDI